MSDIAIMIGVSGSGKSYKAKEVQRRALELGVDEPTVICSTDKFIEQEA